MKICFTSYRPFADGPVTRPFLESDPVNIAYSLGGSYLSFLTLKNLSTNQLEKLFKPYDLIIVALDVEAIELVSRIINVCRGRVATYSEGHISDYQRLSPYGQVSFVKAIRSAIINFLYWERYIPFYRALTAQPVEYLPYPYLLGEAHRYYITLSQRPLLVAAPSGLAGLTRNGLATLAVTKQLLESQLVSEIACWLEPKSFQEDCQSITYFLFSAPIQIKTRKMNWRDWLISSRIDYRPLLRIRSRLKRVKQAEAGTGCVRIKNAVLYRRTSWTNYLTQLAPARILVDLNDRETVGRNALDCAALGIPYVSTKRSDLAPKIFPETMIADPWDVETAADLCQRLLDDNGFYKRVVDHAAAAVEQFSLDSFPRRFNSLITKHHIVPRPT